MSRGSVAQLVERSTENRKVTGSMPVGATRTVVTTVPEPSVDSFQVFGEGVEDVFGGLGRDEWLRVLVPRCDPFPEVFLKRLHAAVVRVLQQIAGEFGEEPLDLVGPG